MISINVVSILTKRVSLKGPAVQKKSFSVDLGEIKRYRDEISRFNEELQIGGQSVGRLSLHLSAFFSGGCKDVGSDDQLMRAQELFSSEGSNNFWVVCNSEAKTANGRVYGYHDNYRYILTPLSKLGIEGCAVTHYFKPTHEGGYDDDIIKADQVVIDWLNTLLGSEITIEKFMAHDFKLIDTQKTKVKAALKPFLDADQEIVGDVGAAKQAQGGAKPAQGGAKPAQGGAKPAQGGAKPKGAHPWYMDTNTSDVKGDIKDLTDALVSQIANSEKLKDSAEIKLVAQITKTFEGFSEQHIDLMSVDGLETFRDYIHGCSDLQTAFIVFSEKRGDLDDKYLNKRILFLLVREIALDIKASDDISALNIKIVRNFGALFTVESNGLAINNRVTITGAMSDGAKAEEIIKLVNSVKFMKNRTYTDLLDEVVVLNDKLERVNNEMQGLILDLKTGKTSVATLSKRFKKKEDELAAVKKKHVAELAEAQAQGANDLAEKKEKYVAAKEDADIMEKRYIDDIHKASVALRESNDKNERNIAMIEKCDAKLQAAKEQLADLRKSSAAELQAEKEKLADLKKSSAAKLQAAKEQFAKRIQSIESKNDKDRAIGIEKIKRRHEAVLAKEKESHKSDLQQLSVAAVAKITAAKTELADLRKSSAAVKAELEAVNNAAQSELTALQQSSAAAEAKITAAKAELAAAKEQHASEVAALSQQLADLRKSSAAELETVLAAATEKHKSDLQKFRSFFIDKLDFGELKLSKSQAELVDAKKQHASEVADLRKSSAAELEAEKAKLATVQATREEDNRLLYMGMYFLAVCLVFQIPMQLWMDSIE